MRNLVSTLLLSLTAGLLALGGCGSGNDDAGKTTPTVQARKIVTVTETDAMSLPGQVVPASTDTVTLWLGPGVARRDVGDGSLLLHPSEDRLTWLDHRARTWTSQTGTQLRRQLTALAADTLGLPDEDIRLQRLRSMLNVDVKVIDTEEVSEIDGYRCRRWLVEQHMGDQSTVSELWLTRDVPVDWNLLHRISQPTLAALPGGPDALAELARLDGFPVRSFAVLEIMNRKGRTESRLLSVETVEVPRSFFRPPPDYGPATDPSR